MALFLVRAAQHILTPFEIATALLCTKSKSLKHILPLLHFLVPQCLHLSTQVHRAA